MDSELSLRELKIGFTFYQSSFNNSLIQNPNLGMQAFSVGADSKLNARALAVVNEFSRLVHKPRDSSSQSQG